MIEFLFEVLGEFILQCLIQVSAELGFHTVAETFQRKPNPWMAAIGYGLFGAILGGLSLLVFPNHLVVGGWRIFNLVAAPIVTGFFMCLMGKWREKRGDELLRIDRFSYGYLFALSFALIRFYFAK